jgi:bacillolysin
VQIMLEGTDSDKYSVKYEAHVQNEGWQSWAKDGEVSGSFGKSQRVEALKVLIVHK